MKKLLLSIAALCSGMGYVSAQYYHYQYGSTAGRDFCTHGFNTQYVDVGQLQIGQTIANSSLFTVFNTDQNGNPFPAPYFGNEYTTFNSAGTLVNLHGPSKGVEFSNGLGYGIAGGFVDPASPIGVPEGVYFISINPGGGVGPTFAYNIPALSTGAFRNYRVANVIESFILPNNYFIVGTVSHPSLGECPFVIRTTNTGAFVSRVYTLTNTTTPPVVYEATDIVENRNVGEIAISGRSNYFTSSAGTFDGTLMAIDPNTLVTIPGNQVFFFGTTTSNDEFTSIDLARNNVYFPATAPGYILGGNTDANGSVDFWSVLVTPVLPGGPAPVWQSAFDYSRFPNVPNYLTDIKERFSFITGRYEYYLGGYTTMGVFGNMDIHVVKVDQNGNGVLPFGEFTYGTQNLQETSVSLDGFTTGAFGPPDALTVFGHSSTAASSVVLDQFRTYFNGVTACDFKLTTPLQYPAPTLFTRRPVTYPSRFVAAKINASVNPANFYGGCFAPAISTGDNSKVLADKTNTGLGIKLSSNMLSMDNETKLSIDNNLSSSVNVTIKLTDIVGREYYANAISVAQGQNEIPLALSSLNLTNSGIYVLSVTDDKGSVIRSMKVFINK